MTTAITTLTRRIPLVNLDKCSAAPFCFVLKLPNHFAPIGVTNGLSKSRILDHVFNAQTLTANHLVFVYQRSGEFVGKVAQLPRIVSLHDFRIERANDRNLVFSVIAKTYRYEQGGAK